VQISNLYPSLFSFRLSNSAALSFIFLSGLAFQSYAIYTNVQRVAWAFITLSFSNDFTLFWALI
jgi:hypothetical protein